MKCSKCGKRIKKSFKLCPSCGEKVVIEKKKYKLKKKPIIITSIVLFALILISMILLFGGNSIGKNRKSVVKINVYNKDGEIIQTGSGYIIFDKNTLITNAHVITYGDSAEAITEDDERLFIKGAIYYDQDEDIAILKLNNQNKLKPLKYTTDYKVGDKVVAIGSPLGIKNSVSDGIISNIGDDGIIQHTAPISHGSSGGALFTNSGKLIGMNTASYVDGQNLNLAIPIEKIKKIYNENKKNKVKKITEIQYLSKNINSIMLNNSVGRKIVDIVEDGWSQKNTYELGYTDPRKRIKNYVNTYWLKQLMNSGEIIDYYEYQDVGEIDDNGNLVEPSKLLLLIIYKVSGDSVEKVEEYVKEKYLSGLNDRIWETPSTLINGEWVRRTYSNNYRNAYMNITISSYNDYVYVIASKDEKTKNDVIKLIKQLP